jgi:hypothetical protein
MTLDEWVGKFQKLKRLNQEDVRLGTRRRPASPHGHRLAPHHTLHYHRGEGPARSAAAGSILGAGRDQRADRCRSPTSVRPPATRVWKGGITLETGGAAVYAQINLNGRYVGLSPGNLKPNTTYTLRLGATLCDQDGMAVEAPASFDFTTGAGPTPQPAVDWSIGPADGSAPAPVKPCSWHARDGPCRHSCRCYLRYRALPPHRNSLTLTVRSAQRPGHATIQTTERYLGSRQNLAEAVNDRLGLEIDAAVRLT